MGYSPLFWPIELKGNTIYILDETRLPQRLVYLKAKNYLEAARAIEEMKTRAVGQVLLVMYIFLQALKQNKKDLKKIAAAINATRPTLPFKFLTDMVLGWQARILSDSCHCEGAERPKQSRNRDCFAPSGLAMTATARSLIDAHLEKCILGFLEGLKHSRVKQAEEASKLFHDGDAVLTHCNVSGLLPLIADFCRRESKKISFFVTETRPYLQGLRLTVWELERAGIPVTVITDNMAAYTMAKGKVNKVIVGADHLAQNGDIANKIGTYQLAILAKHFHLPFYVLCPPAADTRSGKEIKIEVRPDKEMLEFCGRRIAPKGVRGYYPAFDITPNKLISKHIYLELGK